MVTGPSRVKKVALITILAGTVIVGGWIWVSFHHILPTVVIGLAGIGVLSLFQRQRFFRWAGISAVWAFYAPVLLALAQVSISMAMLYGGWVAFFYTIWSPLLHFDATHWIVRGRVTALEGIQGTAPIFIFVGSVLLVVGLAQIIRAKLQKTDFVTDGLYSMVRHPQYLGVNILTLGFVLHGLRPIDFIAWITLVLLHLLLAESEEGKLQKKFGAKYLEYKKRVPFVLPFVPNKFRQYLGRLLPGGWKGKAIFVGIYLSTIVVLLIVLKSHVYLMR